MGVALTEWSSRTSRWAAGWRPCWTRCMWVPCCALWRNCANTGRSESSTPAFVRHANRTRASPSHGWRPGTARRPPSSWSSPAPGISSPCEFCPSWNSTPRWSLETTVEIEKMCSCIQKWLRIRPFSSVVAVNWLNILATNLMALSFSMKSGVFL